MMTKPGVPDGGHQCPPCPADDRGRCEVAGIQPVEVGAIIVFRTHSAAHADAGGR